MAIKRNNYAALAKLRSTYGRKGNSYPRPFPQKSVALDYNKIVLPGLIVIAFLFRKKISEWLKDLIPSASSFTNTDIYDDSGKTANEEAKKILKLKGVVPGAYHANIANSVFTIFNTSGGFSDLSQIFSSSISYNLQTQIFNLLTNISPSDLAAVHVSYGVRKLNNRQSTLLGFIWDDTNGTLRDHVNRYFSGDARGNKQKKPLLLLIDTALKTYIKN
ncbi:MAG: hypothetical protein ABI295_02360 [Xanthomarina sp.]